MSLPVDVVVEIRLVEAPPRASFLKRGYLHPWLNDDVLTFRAELVQHLLDLAHYIREGAEDKAIKRLLAEAQAVAVRDPRR